jgi:hypothetical protein
MTVLETLRIIEVYLQSISEPIPTTILPPASRATRSTPPNSTTNVHSLDRPYVPSHVWTHSTWEDWTQLDPADILHVPFHQDEIDVLEKLVSKQAKRSKMLKERDFFWQLAAMRLPGRSPLDCRCFWSDYKNNHLLHNQPMLIRRIKGGALASRYQLLSKRKQTGMSRLASMRKTMWSNMTKESTVTDGSGDAICLAIYNHPRRG